MALTGNIAVLKLKTPLNFEEGIIQPACLPESDLHPIKGEIVVTSGWGFTENDVAPNKLLVLYNSAYPLSSGENHKLPKALSNQQSSVLSCK